MARFAHAAWALSSLIAGIFLGMGMIVLIVGIHDEHAGTEDSRVVWVCSIQGNRQCGPDSQVVSVVPENILFW